LIGKSEWVSKAVLGACVILPVSSVWAAGWVQRHDDSVRRNGEVSKQRRADQIVIIPPQAHYLMKQAILTSSIGLNEVRFSGYKNSSPYPLVISLEFAGVPRDKHASIGVVNGVGVGWNPEVSTFEVPPGSNYGFNVQSTYVISAWVVAGIEENRDSAAQAAWIALQRQTGLPSKDVFERPTRQGQIYQGCLETKMNSQITEIGYYYTIGRWTDGADPLRDVEQVPGLGLVVPGNTPLNPGVCKVRNINVSSPESGGGL
jgi:hypothetical protein